MSFSPRSKHVPTKNGYHHQNQDTTPCVNQVLGGTHQNDKTWPISKWKCGYLLTLQTSTGKQLHGGVGVRGREIDCESSFQYRKLKIKYIRILDNTQ